MNQLVAKTNGNGALDPAILESLVLGGDVGKLTPTQKVQYVGYRCKQLNLDPAAQPFQLLRLQGKEVLYATAGCTQQLCQSRGLSVSITKREKIEDIYCVEARVTDKDGRYTENMGSVPLTGLKGEALSNALLKATTKAIRRTVLAHCGLGVLDELEVETIPGAQMEKGRGNPLRQEFAALSFELDACKSQEQIDLLFDSPEYQDFKRRDAMQSSGMSFAGMMEDKAEQMRKKLPERIRYEGNKIVATTNAEAEIVSASRADVAPAGETITQESASESGSNSLSAPEPSQFSPLCERIMERFDLVDDADSFKEAQKLATDNQKLLTADEKKALNELSRRVGARLREAA